MDCLRLRRARMMRFTSVDYTTNAALIAYLPTHSTHGNLTAHRHVQQYVHVTSINGYMPLGMRKSTPHTARLVLRPK